jgi:hypothetical protein
MQKGRAPRNAIQWEFDCSFLSQSIYYGQPILYLASSRTNKKDHWEGTPGKGEDWEGVPGMLHSGKSIARLSLERISPVSQVWHQNKQESSFIHPIVNPYPTNSLDGDIYLEVSAV